MAIDFLVNWVAVLVTAAIGFVIGFIWYGFLFMKPWAKAVGLDPKGKDPAPVRNMLIGFIITIISVYVLALFITNTGSNTPLGGMLIAAIIWLGCSLTAGIGRVIWEKKPMSLFWINIPYELMNMLIVGAILGAWL